MKGPWVSDHALIRYLERVEGRDMEGLRKQISASLARANDIAQTFGMDSHVNIGAAVFVLRNGSVVTVLDRARRLANRAMPASDQPRPPRTWPEDTDV
jgi:hypothetical protein